jgi:hypothetical protein
MFFELTGEVNQVVSSKHYCFICEGRFGHNGTGLREFHHIIPTYLGGADGPLVVLCERDHGAVHLAATAMIKAADKWLTILHEDATRVLGTLDNNAKSKLRYLADVIYKAHIKFADDPNKRIKMNVSLNGAQNEKANKLKAIYGLKSKEELLVKLLDERYEAVLGRC